MGDPSALRRSIFAVWRWPVRVWIILAMTQLVFVGYLLSEAPQLYWLYETENYDGALNNFIRKYRPYRPAEWVYDNTPLHYPLLRWAEFWGVDYPIEVSSLERRGLGCKNIYRPEEHDSDESE